MDEILKLSEQTMRAYKLALDRGDTQTAAELRAIGWQLTSTIARLGRERVAAAQEQAEETLS